MSVKRQKPNECHILELLPIAVLASVLGAKDYWRNAHKLMLVCKAFHDAVRHPNFWMPAVRSSLKGRARTTHAPLFDYVNPFFRFPEYVANCPSWPWWTFLQWLFPNKGASIRVGADDESKSVYLHSHESRQSLVFEQYAEESCGLHTRWLLNTVGDSVIPAICVTKHEGKHPVATVYYVTVDDKYVWYDGPLTSGKHWRGSVREVSEKLILPMTG